MPKTLEAHPFANLLPMMSDAEYAALKLDIERGAQRDPVVLLDGKILDGRNRYRACLELKREPKTTDYKASWGDPLDYVKSKAQHRHMSESQRACVAIQFGEQIARQNSDGGPCRYVSNDDLGALFAVNRDHVSKARTLHEKSPKLFDDVFHDRLPVHRAWAEYKRRAKKKNLAKLAKDLNLDGGVEWKVLDGDMVDLLGNQRLPEFKTRLVFIDPPYNIGIDYGRGAKADSLPREKFIDLSRSWIGSAQNQLTDDGSLFVMTSMEYLGAYETILRERGLHWRATIIWVETFGTYTPGNFSPCCRPILYFTKSATKRVWHGDQILIPSDRQTIYGDSRANLGGKVPSNVWDDIPRLVGNDGDRMPGFPTQIPREITDRIVQCCSDPGDLVIDGFNGSGTTGVSAVTHGRRYLGVELVPANAIAARARIAAALAEAIKKKGAAEVAKRIAPAVKPERLTNVEATTDTVVEVMHRRYRDSSIEQLLVDPVSAIDMACEVAVELGDLKAAAAKRIYEAVRGAMDEHPGAQVAINRILRTALSSRKRGDLRRDRY